MTEFVEVMKQKKRLHEYQVNKWNSDNVSCCTDCPLNLKKHRHCEGILEEYPQEAEKIIMQWASEYPIKTNAEKLKEVFGADIHSSKRGCAGIECPKGQEKCSECQYYKFWEKEYTEPKEIQNND